MNPSHSSYVEYGTGKIQIKSTVPILGSGFLLGVYTHQIYSCLHLHDINHLLLIGNMLNIDAGTIKRKIDSNEYDDEIIQEVQVQSPLAHLAILTQVRPSSSCSHYIHTHCHTPADITHKSQSASSVEPCRAYFFLSFFDCALTLNFYFSYSDWDTSAQRKTCLWSQQPRFPVCYIRIHPSYTQRTRVPSTTWSFQRM